LFQKASGIEELLNELNQEAAKVIGFKENGGDFYKADPAVYTEQFLNPRVASRNFVTGCLIWDVTERARLFLRKLIYEP
jgi:hypothetical protein